MQDLASVEEREAAAALAARLSPTAVLLPCERGQVPLDQLLYVRAFSVARCLQLDPSFLVDAAPPPPLATPLSFATPSSIHVLSIATPTLPPTARAAPVPPRAAAAAAAAAASASASAADAANAGAADASADANATPSGEGRRRRTSKEALFSPQPLVVDIAKPVVSTALPSPNPNPSSNPNLTPTPTPTLSPPPTPTPTLTRCTAHRPSRH